MKRNRTQCQACRNGCKAMLLAAGMALTLSACDDGPGNPIPPTSPPRPVTQAGQVSKPLALIAPVLYSGRSQLVVLDACSLVFTRTHSSEA